jgi:hypothetical protein
MTSNIPLMAAIEGDLGVEDGKIFAKTPFKVHGFSGKELSKFFRLTGVI